MGGMPTNGNLPKVKKENSLDVTITTIVGGMAIAILSDDLQLIGYTLSGIGLIITVTEFKSLLNPYRTLFENCKLTVGDSKQVPKLIKKRNTDYGYCLTLSLPYGLSTDDFKKKQLAIEEYLNKRIEISYHNYRVYMKVFEADLKANQPYRKVDTKGVLEFPIGNTYGDQIVTVDLGEVTHVLIASETGGGKSTLIRGIITHLILKEKVVLHLIDLKNGAEFNCFRLSKSVRSFSRSIEEAGKVLIGMNEEVERRYNLFFDNGVVDIGEYNQIKGIAKLNYQVIIIDEFADLQNEKPIIDSMVALARKSRASGIHLIIATQRPSADVVTGNLKANMKCVIGLKTLNSLNSRIVIDENGLEKLRGKGHGLMKYSGLTEFQSMDLQVPQVRELIKHTFVEKKKAVVPKEQPIGVVDDMSFFD